MVFTNRHVAIELGSTITKSTNLGNSRNVYKYLTEECMQCRELKENVPGRNIYTNVWNILRIKWITVCSTWAKLPVRCANNYRYCSHYYSNVASLKESNRSEKQKLKINNNSNRISKIIKYSNSFNSDTLTLLDPLTQLPFSSVSAHL